MSRYEFSQVSHCSRSTLCPCLVHKNSSELCTLVSSCTGSQCTYVNCFAILDHVVQTRAPRAPVCALNLHNNKHSAPMSALKVYTVSFLSRAFIVYTVECTSCVHFTGIVHRLVHLQRTLHGQRACTDSVVGGQKLCKPYINW